MEPNVDNSLNTGVPAAHGLSTFGSAPISGQASSSSQPMTSPVLNTPQQASDAELIEETWINAAHRAVAANRNDPRTMSDAISALRREYLLQRYGKSVETNK